MFCVDLLFSHISEVPKTKSRNYTAGDFCKSDKFATRGTYYLLFKSFF